MQRLQEKIPSEYLIEALALESPLDLDLDSPHRCFHMIESWDQPAKPQNDSQKLANTPAVIFHSIHSNVGYHDLSTGNIAIISALGFALAKSMPSKKRRFEANLC